MIDQGALLATGGMIDATLEDAAAVTMSSDDNAMVADGIEDELSVMRTQVVETLLNDMVAVEVLDELHDIVFESGDDQLSLLRSGDVLDHSLQSASAMLIERDLRHGWNRFLDEDGALLGVGMLEKTLAEIVAERIDHELGEVILDLLEDDLNVLRILLFKLPLQEATAMLVLAQSIDLPGDIWNGGGLELVISVGLALHRATAVVSSNRTTSSLATLWVLVAVVATLLVLRH